ncbi:MAG: [LysW]-aminoadipate kinase [Candidatus Dormibacteria bacterium]
MLVIKAGGSLRNLEPLLGDVAAAGGPMVLLHGANRDLDELATRLGHPPRMVTSERGEVSRYSDASTMDLFLMAYAGRANKRIVESLRRLGVNALGLTAMDGGIAVGRRKPHLRISDGDRVRVLHDDHSGTIERIDPTLLWLLIATGHLPVLCPPALSHEGEAINVDGDRLAMEMAVSLGATRMLIFADIPGLLRDVDDETSLIERVQGDEIDSCFVHTRGRARVKLRAAQQALRRGVGAVVLADGRREHPLRDALAGSGTWLLP